MAEIAIALGITMFGILLRHALQLRVPFLEESDAIRCGTYLPPLLTFLLPIAGLAAAMWGGAAAPPLVYWYKVKARLYLPGESPRMATATVRIGLESR